ncbi:reverse transcriptase domain-containing protein [Tanacetum coccineum]
MVRCSAEDRKRKSIMMDEDWMNVSITFPPVLARDLSEEAIMVEAKIEGYLVQRIHVDEGTSIEIMRVGKKQAVEPTKEMKPQEKISLTEEALVNPAHPDQLVAVGKNLSPEGSTQLKNLLKKNKDIFAWEPSDMTGVPRRIIKHALNANPSVVLMPFGLKNAGATYQRLVDDAFQSQIGWNLEAYVDDMVVKSKSEREMITDVAETFDNLRRINMKLNPKKCSFWVEEGKFLGYMVTSKGIRANPTKTKDIAEMQSPKTWARCKVCQGSWQR